MPTGTTSEPYGYFLELFRPSTARRDLRKTETQKTHYLRYNQRRGGRDQRSWNIGCSLQLPHFEAHAPSSYVTALQKAPSLPPMPQLAN